MFQKGNKKKVKFSIIVTTIVGYAKTNKFFLSLSNQTYKNFELIFIDQSNSFKFYYLKKFNIKNFKFIPIRKTSLSNARNIGIKQARGKYFMFLDDDCYFNDLFLHNINFYLKKNFDLMGFQIKNYNENIIVDKFIKKKFRYRFEIIKYLCSSNFVIKSNNKNFNTYLGVGSKFLAQSGEDTDYLLRNFKNKKFYFQKNITIFHPKPKNEKKLKKVFLYSIGQSVILMKNKCYLIFLFSVMKNFFDLITKPKNFRSVYLIGKFYGFFYYFFIRKKLLTTN